VRCNTIAGDNADCAPYTPPSKYPGSSYSRCSAGDDNRGDTKTSSQTGHRTTAKGDSRYTGTPSSPHTQHVTGSMSAAVHRAAAAADPGGPVAAIELFGTGGYLLLSWSGHGNRPPRQATPTGRMAVPSRRRPAIRHAAETRCGCPTLIHRGH
jgi:hypothetical protein